MPRKPSPLEPLVRLRDEHAQASARALGDAAKSERQALERVEARKNEQTTLVAQQAQTASSERSALEQGALRAGDLLQGGFWSMGARAERTAAETRVHSAEKARQQATAHLQAARTEVERTRAEAQAADELLKREQHRATIREQAALEEAAEDAFASRWKPSVRPGASR